ncbi:nuclease-related domain-containing protein [Neobacillus novalis]|uniref:Nuclease-related domain-containing protein n=1 Tax=Neobacillus novalis TaxID=220687 RepID=A0AA95MS28_9BACI|nr:nuclease-related domain-containing protein [Neobacillus novalis]WHY88966.1 nuclease-related domain-containing protein [Neobacillus novalis]
MELTPPTLLLQAEALERRITETHRSMRDIKLKIRILRSGYNGEKTLKYYLEQIPEHKYHIFHGLRLPTGNAFFQIDALLLSRKIILILDAKNHSGILRFEKNQLIHEYAGNREIYENPVAQVNRHKIQLRNLFEKNNIPFIPIENLVTVCKPSTEIIISTGYKEADQKVIKAFDLLNRIEELEERYSEKKISQKSVTKVINLLLSQHTPQRIDILKMFQIAKEEKITGVQCPRCLYIPMDYKRAKWICPKCFLFSTEAFINGINDYFLLNKPTFSNREIREFLHLPNSRTTTAFLHKLNYPYSGSQKGRIYHHPNAFP